MNEELIKALKENQESALSAITKLQAETSKKFGELDADSKAKQEKIEAEISEKMKKMEEITAKLANIEKDHKDLELKLAKKAESGEKKAGDPEIREAFRKSLLNQANFSEANHEKTMVELVKEYMPQIPEEKRELFVKTMMVGSDPDGGYLCPVDVSTRIIRKIFETSPMRSVATTVNTLAASYKKPIFDTLMGAGWVDELETRTATATPTIAEIEIPAHELYAYPSITLQLLEDASRDMEAEIGTEAGRTFGLKENEAFVTGNGIKKPKGFLSYAETTADYERFKITTKETAGAGVIASNDLIVLHSLLKTGYLPNAKFVMSRKIWTEILKLKDTTTGAYLLNPRLLFEGYKPQLLGAGVVFFDDMPKTVVTGAQAVAFGDFEQGYNIVDRIGITAIRDNITSPGKVKIYFRKRVGGGVVDFDAIKVLKIQ